MTVKKTPKQQGKAKLKKEQRLNSISLGAMEAVFNSMDLNELQKLGTKVTTALNKKKQKLEQHTMKEIVDLAQEVDTSLIKKTQLTGAEKNLQEKSKRIKMLARLKADRENSYLDTYVKLGKTGLQTSIKDLQAKEKRVVAQFNTIFKKNVSSIRNIYQTKDWATIENNSNFMSILEGYEDMEVEVRDALAGQKILRDSSYKSSKKKK